MADTCMKIPLQGTDEDKTKAHKKRWESGKQIAIWTNF